MTKKHTKRALFTSALVLLLCLSMLVGTTFAWFTDNVSTGRNTIQSGNLDVVLEYKTNWSDAWVPVTENTKLFKEGTLYEPGYTEVVFLRVSNAGSLALKYNLNVSIIGETTSTNVAGETFSLKDYLEIGYYVQDEYASGANYADLLMPGMFGTREAALASVKTTKLSADTGIIRADAPVLVGEQTSQVIALVLTMPTTVGNEANHKTGVAAPTIDLGINLVATQFTHEGDSFNNKYDEDATYPTLVSNVTELNDLLATGGNATLTGDITAPLANSAIYGTPVAVQMKAGGTLDGNGNSLDIENPQYNGYAIETYGGTITNLTINSTVGRGIVISAPSEDIYVTNVVVDGPGYALNTTEHNGKKLIATNSTFNGWTSFAGLESASFTKCTFGENTSKYWQGMGYDQDYDRLIRPYVSTTFTGCVFEQGFYIDLSALDAGCTITLDNCTANGTVITAENYTSYITIELPSGRTLADCVSFK